MSRAKKGIDATIKGYVTNLEGERDSLLEDRAELIEILEFLVTAYKEEGTPFFRGIRIASEKASAILLKLKTD